MKNKLFYVLLVTVFLLVALPDVLSAQEVVEPPEGVEFSEIQGRRRLALNNCPLVEGVTKVYVTDQGRYIQLPPSNKRGPYKLARRQKFFACADRGDGQFAIFTKGRADGQVTRYDLTLSDFPGNSIDAACSSIRSWPGSLIYKTIGSPHFYDCRRNTIGVIAKYGFSGPYPSRIDLLDIQGNNVGSVVLYARGGEYAARWYACIGGAPARNGRAVADLARRNTGSSNVYFDFGNICFGPVPADKCINSKQC